MKNKEIEELLNDMSKVYEAHVKIIDKYNNADEIHYASPISLKQIKLLLSYIEQLEKRNKELYEGFMATQEELTYYATKNEQLEKKVDQYENPEDLTLFYMWLDTKAKDKMKQMENEITNLKQQNQMITELGEQLENKYESLLEDRRQLLNVVNILQNNRDKAIEQCNDWIKIYKKLNSDERLILRLEEIFRILKGGGDE